MYLVIGLTLFKFKEFIGQSEKTQLNWKTFTSKPLEPIKEIEEFVGILDSADI